MSTANYMYHRNDVTFYHTCRSDPFENRVTSIDDEEESGSESKLHDDQDRGAVQAPPIKLAMWVSCMYMERVISS